MSFSKLTVVAFLSSGYVKSQNLASINFPSMMEDWANDGADAGPTNTTTWATSFDFIKDHGCNCPALFDEFAIFGINKNDTLDMSCHTLRQCLKCASEDTACESDDINALSFNWKWTDKAVCDSNTPCEMSKCNCYVDFLNSLIDNYDTNSQVAIAGNDTTCVAQAGKGDSCCMVDGKWKLYDSTTHACSNNAIKNNLPSRNNEYMQVDPNVDWKMTFNLKIDSQRPAINIINANYGIHSIFSVGNSNQERLPGLWFHSRGMYDLLFTSNCAEDNYDNQQLGTNPKVRTNWAIGETHAIKVEYLKTSNQAKLYSDDRLLNTVQLLDCGIKDEQTLWFSEPYYRSSGGFSSISNINFEYL